MPGCKRKPGRPAVLRDPEDFGTELTFEELGACLGMSRYRAVAQQLATGEWWTNQARA